jgi:hypothetical protein
VLDAQTTSGVIETAVLSVVIVLHAKSATCGIGPVAPLAASSLCDVLKVTNEAPRVACNRGESHEDLLRLGGLQSDAYDSTL